jgi:hypothetical protein
MILFWLMVEVRKDLNATTLRRQDFPDEWNQIRSLILRRLERRFMPLGNFAYLMSDNHKTASILGCLACVMGCLSILLVIVEGSVYSGGGITPASVPYTIIANTSALGALFFGIPLGGCAWHFGRKQLGVMGITLCILPFVATFFVRYFAH